MKKTALTMIARNEERCIARCLDSVAPWVDEMIVLDTGSTDRTVEIALDHGAKVYHHHWKNDFSEARNAVLEKSNADWNLVLDADEWILAGGEHLKSLRTRHERSVQYVKINNDIGEEGSGLNTSYEIIRILPKEVRYTGRIHEQPFYRFKTEKSPIIIRHDGYLSKQLKKKIGRNINILKQEITEQPENPYYHFQLAKEYDIHQQTDLAIDHYLHAHRLSTNRPPWLHDLVIRLINCMMKEGRIEEAMIFASDEMGYWDKSPDFHFSVGVLLLEQMNRHPEQGLNLLPMIEESWLKALRIGEQPELPGSVSGHGSFIAAKQLWALYEVRRDSVRAQQYRDLHKRLYKAHQDSLMT